MNASLLYFLVLFSACTGQNLPEQKAHTPRNGREAIGIVDPITQIGHAGIHVVFQDKNKNYWFAGDGVYKFDGVSLVLFTTDDGLCSNTIVRIQEDAQGHVYFDTPDGVSKFDGHAFTTLEIANAANTRTEAWRLEPNDLWFGMGWDAKGPYRYDGQYLYALEFPETDRADAFYAKYPNASWSSYGIYSIYRDRAGAVWFGTAALGLCRYDGKSIRWLYEDHLSRTPEGGDFGIRSIIEDSKGYFWFCNTRYRYALVSRSSDAHATDHISYRKDDGVVYTNDGQRHIPYFMSITEDDNGHLWMATYDNGVWRNDGKELIHYPVKNGEKSVSLFSIYKDRHGLLWLGTQNNGVYVYNGREFEKFDIEK